MNPAVDFNTSYNPYISAHQDVHLLPADTVKDLEDISLIPCAGDDVVILDPTDPANPAVSEVETGGSAYRYYRIAVKGLDNRWYAAGSRELQVRVDGMDIPQGTTNSLLPGKVTGRSDPDGSLRVEIPASSLPFCGEGDVELLYANKAIRDFTVRHKPRTYEKTTSHEVSVGISGVASAKLAVKGVIEGTASSEIKNKVIGGNIEDTTYAGVYALEAKRGVGVISPGQVALGVARVGAEATVGNLFNFSIEEEFKFPSGIVTDTDKTRLAYLLVEPAVYAMRSTSIGALLYLALDNYKLSVVLDNWEKSTLEIKRGSYGKCEVAAYAGAKPNKVFNVGLDVEVSSELLAVSKLAIARDYYETSGGVSAEGRIEGGVGVLLGKYDKEKAKNDFPMPNLFIGGGRECGA